MRLEKKGTKKHYFAELLLDGHRVYFAEGFRGPFDHDWVMKDSDSRRYGFKDEPKKAKPFFDEKVAELEAKGYKRAGKDTVVTAMKRKDDEKAAKKPKIDPAKKVEKDARKAERRKSLEAGPVYWVRAKNQYHDDQFAEVTVKGNVVLCRSGDIGKKGRTETTKCDSHEEAINSGLTSLNLFAAMDYGPPD